MQREVSTTNTGVFMGQSAPEGKILKHEHEHSGGPYAVVQLSLGEFDLTIYPGTVEQNEQLASVLIDLGEQLATINEEIRIERAPVTALVD